jgi:prepilin-type N-terminal cleavage/methylation domain-containing protein
MKPEGTSRSRRAGTEVRSNCRLSIVNCQFAFTLVEMLVTMLILAIGVALVVGVAANVQEDARTDETRHAQSVVLAALEVYHKTQGAYPADAAEDDRKLHSSVLLLRALRANADSREILRRLAGSAIWQDDDGKEYLMDGFGNPIQYDRDAGLGGKKPLLLSHGHDDDDLTDDIATE